MASTFTSNINLEKPAQGDQVDAWGTTVNSNSDIIDTQIANKLPLAGGTVTGDIEFNDNVKASFGDANDFEIYHSGASSIVREASAGNLTLAGNDVNITNGAMNETHIDCNNNGSVDLYHDNSKKFETSATGATLTGNLAVTGTVDGRDLQTDGTKLDAIEASATADQTASEIRTLVESATDSNVFTDADHTKLNGIEASADVTDATNVDAAGAIMNSDVATKGQIIVGDGSGDPTILSVGTDGHYLKADSSAGSGVAWASVPAGVGGSNGVDFNDDVKARFGTGNDLEIYHDGNDSYIHDGGTGTLIIRGSTAVRITNTGGDNMFQGTDGGDAKLYHAGSEKLATASGGVSVSGTLTATTLSGSLPYSDLTGTPTIPSNNNQLTNGAGYTTYTSNQATDSTSAVSFSGVSINGNYDLTLNAGNWTGEKSGKIQRHSNHMYFQTANAGSWIFRNQSGSEFFNIQASNGAATSSNNITAYSDIRLKKDVTTIENALDKVCAMRGVMYTRKSNDEREVGVIAQEVKEIVPELVSIQETDNSLSDNGLKDIHTMKYQNTVGLLIEAIKELKEEIDILKGKN